jgi:hypothetical protein
VVKGHPINSVKQVLVADRDVTRLDGLLFESVTYKGFSDYIAHLTALGVRQKRKREKKRGQVYS